jgi:hypothetical protein
MAARTIPARRKLQRHEEPSLFGPPPLFEGEDAAAYEMLLERFTAGTKPKDVFEQMWVRDIVDLTWEMGRMRRLKARLLTCIMVHELSMILKPTIIEDEISDDEPSDDELEDESSDRELSAYAFAEQWAARKPKAIEEVNKQLSSKGLTLENVAALALSARIEDFERIDRMIMNAEARRNDALRELKRHCTTLAEPLRKASDDVIDADFQDLAPVRRRLRDKA